MKLWGTVCISAPTLNSRRTRPLSPVIYTHDTKTDIRGLKYEAHATFAEKPRDVLLSVDESIETHLYSAIYIKALVFVTAMATLGKLGMCMPMALHGKEPSGAK